MFSTAGRTVKSGLVASAVVSSWTWAATLLQSSGVAYRYGVSGPFWYASGATVQILLFATLAIELKRKAPNAHTFLEVIRARYGVYGHLVFTVFGLMTNILVTAMLLTGEFAPKFMCDLPIFEGSNICSRWFCCCHITDRNAYRCCLFLASRWGILPNLFSPFFAPLAYPLSVATQNRSPMRLIYDRWSCIPLQEASRYHLILQTRLGFQLICNTGNVPHRLRTYSDDPYHHIYLCKPPFLPYLK